MSRAVPPIYQLGAGSRPARRPARPQPLAEHSLKPRLAVLATSTAEVVRFAGGWLVDQGLAGWEVSVLTMDHGDSPPLRILGASGHDLDAVLASPVPLGHCLRAIAISAGLYDRDPRVRRIVLNARQARSAGVRLWGDTGPAGTGSGAGRVRYRLSLAARAFKAQALAAACVPGETAAGFEVFRDLDAPVAAAL
jgi:hypothetical protein